MKRSLLIAVFSTALLAGVQTASAQNSVGANVGYDFDLEEFFAGGQLRFAPATLPIVINPSLETYFQENVTRLRLDLNGLYMFGVDNVTFTPYAGGGLGVEYANPDVGDSVTNAMLNLIFGANFGMGQLRPFAEARIGVGDGTRAALRGGLLFSF